MRGLSIRARLLLGMVLLVSIGLAVAVSMMTGVLPRLRMVDRTSQPFA